MLQLFFKAHDFLTHHFIAMYGHLRVHACRQINSWKQIVLENIRRENAPFFQTFSDLNNLPSCSHKSEIWLQLLWENIWLRKVFLWVTTEFSPPKYKRMSEEQTDKTLSLNENQDCSKLCQQLAHFFHFVSNLLPPEGTCFSQRHVVLMIYVVQSPLQSRHRRKKYKSLWQKHPEEHLRHKHCIICRIILIE